MSKHTKGPWIVDDRDIVDDEGYTIAVAKRVTDHFSDNLDEVDSIATEANARLIAAAPEMLEQLKYCTEVLKNWMPEKAKTLTEECERLINKAEGKE